MGLFGSKPTSPYSAPPSSAPVGPWTLTPGTSSSSSSRPSTFMSGVSGIAISIVGGLLLLIFGIAFYDYLRKRQGKDSIFTGASGSGDTTPSPVDGSKKKVIPLADAPAGNGTNYGVQFWMFIKDWDYKFSQEKEIVKRIGSTGGDSSPYITLHPTDNSLQVRVAIYPNTPGSGAAAAPSTSSNGDTFTCTVENVPLQSWFSVSVTVFQRNLDIYINGRLVKSCVLPGVPKPIIGDMVIGDNGGFSGSVCNLHTYVNPLTPDDAKAFFSAGTSCQAPTPTVGGVDEDSIFITLFGYTFRFSTLDRAGKELSSYTL